MGQRAMPQRRVCGGWFGPGQMTRLARVIHEVDSALRALIERDAGIRDVEVVFDAPTRDWAGRRTGPTIDIYLYDIREDLRRRERGVLNEYNEDQTRIIGRHLPPRHFKLSYLVTAWTQRPEDEHRLLSALLATFLRFEALPAELLDGPLAELNLPVPLTVGLPPPEDRGFADVWSALGGELKPSIDVVVSAPINTGQQFDVGPPVTAPPVFNFGGSGGLGAPEAVGVGFPADSAEAGASESGSGSGARAAAAPGARSGAMAGAGGSAKRGGKKAGTSAAAPAGTASAARAAEATEPATPEEAVERARVAGVRAGQPAQTIRGPASGDPYRVSMRRRRGLTPKKPS
jgi:hypothetical protein